MNNSIIANISEEEYRALPHISYSKISKFITNGPNSLLPSTKETKNHMSLGSLFDTMLTEPNKISEKYFIGKNNLTDNHLDLIKKYAEFYKNDKSNETLNSFLVNENYYPSYKEETRKKYFFNYEDVTKYLEALTINSKLIYCTEQQVNLVQHKIELLKTHPFTKPIFAGDEYELVYQAKVVSDTLNAKCMFDLLLIDHKHRIIAPFDFKFMEDSARNFMRSYEKFNYYIQDTLYTDVLTHELMINDLDYTVLEFTFIVLSSVDDIILQYMPEIDRDTTNHLVYVNNKIKKDWQYYFDLIKWHLTNQIFDYTKEEYDNNGQINIPSTNITNFFSKNTNYGDHERSNTTPNLTDDLPF